MKAAISRLVNEIVAVKQSVYELQDQLLAASEIIDYLQRINLEYEQRIRKLESLLKQEEQR